MERRHHGYGRPFSHAEGRPDAYDRRMRKRALVLALLVGSLVLASCSGDNDPVSNVTATSATFNAHGTCDSGQPNPCEWRWRYRKVGDSAWTETPLQGPVTGSASNVPLKWDVSGLTPGTQYEEQIGGRGDNVSTISWTSSTVKFTTAAATNTVFSDGFESGDFASWSQVQTAGDGTAVVQSAVVKTGAAAAQLSESATAGSKAYIRKTLPSAQQELTVSGAFRIATAPASGGNVPFFRLLDPASARVVSIYRQNGSAGTIGLGFGGANVTTTGKLALGTWATVELHVITAGTSSTIEVKLNGAQVYATTTASLGTAGVQTIQVGNDTAAQAFTLAADDIDVEGAGSATPSAPANVTLPTISGTAQAGQTLTASTGTWAGTQPITYTYQWQRCDSAGATCAAIANATAGTYAATATDVGKTLRVVVAAKNSVGTTNATSNATVVVQGASTPPSNTALPTITGSAQQGQTLTAVPGGWDGSQPITYTYAWQRCDSGGAVCVPISGATATSYLIVAADVGKTLRVAVKATNGSGNATATSAATAVVQATQTQPGLVALWHMDETSGTTMADAVGGHTGTLHSVALGQAGFAGTAYGFNGTSSYVSVPTASDLNPGGSTITVTIRLKTTKAPASPDWDLIRKGLYTTAGGEWKMEYQPTGQASCGFNGSSGYSELTAGPPINDGQWHTVQCVKTASAIRVVVDGTATSQAATIGTISNTDAVPIGARPGSEFFNGSLDEASVQIG